MEKYIELTVMKDANLPSYVLMSALFEQIHRALVAMKTTSVGVSFPDASHKYIGNKIRLHGSEEDLAQLVAFGSLAQFQNYIKQTVIMNLPPQVTYRIVRRVQSKKTSPSAIRRYMRRHGVNNEEAETLMNGGLNVAPIGLPYLVVESQSTGGQIFKLFVDQKTKMNEPIKGEFNCYGMSSTATIPWF